MGETSLESPQPELSLYRVSYEKARRNSKSSLSWLSQCMRRWVDQKLAIRGSKRGQYVILQAIKNDFLEVATNIGVNPEIKPLEGQEIDRYRGAFLFRPQVLLTASQAMGAVPSSGLNPPAATAVGVVTSPSPSPQFQNKDVSGDWQAVLEGFQLYRSIFETAMKETKLAAGLERALGIVCSQEGLEREQVLQKMDRALEILKNQGSSE